ncbi:hypothetical protein FA95DRAFT_1614024 [Auriscalpium vulgare]|uniref:Uncharacterized protein n=1 Tax=Auriscalpium vulgare TaxID=40419 RepID=A0ACB8R165_9AGAM|nr:hypothetical protein FA95DRAFT_1614024 [Auriscalpium vulgare]
MPSEIKDPQPKTSTTARRAASASPYANYVDRRTKAAEDKDKGPTLVPSPPYHTKPFKGSSYAEAARRGAAKSTKKAKPPVERMDTVEDAKPKAADQTYTTDFASPNRFDALDPDTPMSPIEEDREDTPTPAKAQEEAGVEEEAHPHDEDDERLTTPPPKPKGKGKARGRSPVPPTPTTAPGSSPTRPPRSYTYGGVPANDWHGEAMNHFEFIRSKYKDTYASHPPPTDVFNQSVSVGLTPDGKVRPVSSVHVEEVDDEDLPPNPYEQRTYRPAPPSPPPHPTPTPAGRSQGPSRPSSSKDHAPSRPSSEHSDTPPPRSNAPPPPKAGHHPPPPPAAKKTTAERLKFARARIGQGSSSSTASPVLANLPSGPFPLIHFSQAADPVQYHAEKQIADWDKEKTPKCLIDVLGQMARNPEDHAAIGALIAAKITELAGEQSPRVSAPLRSAEAIDDKKYSSTFLASRISDRSRTYLEKARILLFPDIQLHVIPYDLVSPARLLTLKNFTTAEEEIIADIAIVTWLSDRSREGLDALVKKYRSAPIPLTHDHIENFIGSMYVKRIDMKGKGGLSTPYFGIYIDPNTLPDDDFWHILRDHFGSLIYESTMYGTGMVQPPSYCPICHGCDHPRGLCPFPLLPAWTE